MVCIIELKNTHNVTKGVMQIINRKATELKLPIYIFENDGKMYTEMPMKDDLCQNALSKIRESLEHELAELDRRLNYDANC